MNVEKELQKRFGFPAFRPGQREVIEDVLSGRDVFAMLPTGSGKSICYLLSGYLLGGLVVIVTPLISLMQDQVQRLRMNGEKGAAALNSFLTEEERERVIRGLGSFRFLYLSPEMLRSSRLQTALKNIGVSLFVVDEAHCISQWGYEFRPEYLKLAEARRNIGQPPCLALTATADDQVRKDIITHLELTDCRLHLYSVDRPNIALCVEHWLEPKEKERRLIELVKQLEGPGIVYFSSRKMTEQMAERLKLDGILQVGFYHGDMSTEDRMLIQNQFLGDQLDVVCATNAFGMGIDKPNIRFVIHYHYPTHINAYMQEIGRAGRDGEPSLAICLVGAGDDRIAQTLIDRELPDESVVKAVISRLAGGNDPYDIQKLAMDNGASETSAQFLCDKLSCVDNQSDAATLFERVMQDVHARRSVKTAELAKVRQWLATNRCRRKTVLQFYGQQPVDRNGPCCDRCGFQLKAYYKKIGDTRRLNQGIEPWQSRLERLLPRR